MGRLLLPIVAILTSVCLSLPRAGLGQTRIPNKQEVFGNWTLKGSPYIIEGEAIVPKGKELIIQPGVQVQFKTGYNSYYKEANFDLGMLKVQGKLRAVGAPNAYIEFTRLGESGYWGSIVIESDDNLLMEYCTFSHGFQVEDVRNTEFNNAFGTLSLHDCKATIRNCLFFDIELWSIFLDESDLNLVNTTIINSYTPIYIFKGTIQTIRNCIFYNYENDNFLDASFATTPGTIEYSIIEKTDLKLDPSNLLGVAPQFDPNFRLLQGSPGVGMASDGSDIGAYGGESPFFEAPFLEDQFQADELWQFAYSSEIKDYLQQKTEEYNKLVEGLPPLERGSIKRTYRQDFRQQLKGFEDRFYRSIDEAEWERRAEIASSLKEIEDRVVKFGPYNSLLQTLPIRGTYLIGQLNLTPAEAKRIFPLLANQSIYANVQKDLEGNSLDTFDIHLRVPGFAPDALELAASDRPVYYPGFNLQEAKRIKSDPRFEISFQEGLKTVPQGGNLEIPFTLKNVGTVPLRHPQIIVSAGLPNQMQISLGEPLPEMIPPGSSVQNKWLIWVRGEAPVGGYSLTVEMEDIYSFDPERTFLGVSITE